MSPTTTFIALVLAVVVLVLAVVLIPMLRGALLRIRSLEEQDVALGDRIRRECALLAAIDDAHAAQHRAAFNRIRSLERRGLDVDRHEQWLRRLEMNGARSGAPMSEP